MLENVLLQNSRKDDWFVTVALRPTTVASACMCKSVVRVVRSKYYDGIMVKRSRVQSLASRREVTIATYGYYILSMSSERYVPVRE